MMMMSMMLLRKDITLQLQVVIMPLAVLVLLVATTGVAATAAGVVNVRQLRMLAAQNNVTGLLVFGDSSVDPGNNNGLRTTFKSNFLPYGKDFFSGRPTGRFTNGRLPTDFVAEVLGYNEVVPAFLDPNAKMDNRPHLAVSFASAASGYDDLTANLTNVLPVWKQLEYLRHYVIRLRRVHGEKATTEMIRNAIFVLSMGANDFMQNYFIEPVRSKQFTVDQYEDYLVACLIRDIKEMHRIGARRLVVVGVPPLGCMPLIKTLMGSSVCVDKYNKASYSFDNKVKRALATLTATIGIRTVFADAYAAIQDAIDNPAKYGFTETTKGCCGTGTFEYGDTCRGMKTCEDPNKYVFWDSVHPTERMYQIVADEVLTSVASQFLS